MRKSHYRDYATEAFRFLARERSSKEYAQRIWNEELERQKKYETISGGISAPTESAVLRAETAVKLAAAALADLEAAEFALHAVEAMRCSAAADAVRMVYMVNPDDEIKRGEIEERVIMATIQIPAGRTTVYRWLSLARDLFAEKRGLRM